MVKYYLRPESHNLPRPIVSGSVLKRLYLVFRLHYVGFVSLEKLFCDQIMIFQPKNELETRSFEVIDMINDLLPLKSLKTEEKECEEVSNREKFVLVIVTGGTLCMKKNEKGNYVPAKGFLNNAIGNISLLHDKDYYDEFIAPRKMLHPKWG